MENGIPVGSPNRIDDHAKCTTEDPWTGPGMNGHPVIESQSKRIAEDQRDRILQQMALLFESMQSWRTKKWKRESGI